MQAVFDASWRKRALGGDQAAIRLLAQAALEPLYRFCFYRVGRNRHLCEEVAQETLVRAIVRLKRYEPRRAANDIFPWLTGLARNEIQKVLAREKSTARLPALWARIDDDLRAIYARLESTPLPHEVLEREETRELVNATMSQLPPHYRQALEAKYVSGQTVRDMAAAGRTTEKAVESLLGRARRAFRETFTTLDRSFDIETTA